MMITWDSENSCVVRNIMDLEVTSRDELPLILALGPISLLLLALILGRRGLQLLRLRDKPALHRTRRKALMRVLCVELLASAVLSLYSASLFLQWPLMNQLQKGGLMDPSTVSSLESGIAFKSLLEIPMATGINLLLKLLVLLWLDSVALISQHRPETGITLSRLRKGILGVTILLALLCLALGFAKYLANSVVQNSPLDQLVHISVASDSLLSSLAMLLTFVWLLREANEQEPEGESGQRLHFLKSQVLLICAITRVLYHVLCLLGVKLTVDNAWNEPSCVNNSPAGPLLLLLFVVEVLTVLLPTWMIVQIFSPGAATQTLLATPHRARPEPEGIRSLLHEQEEPQRHISESASWQSSLESGLVILDDEID